MPSHAHHAIQIVIALHGCIAICGSDGEWRESRGIVLRPDAEHSFDCNGTLGVMVFVDPESSDGAWLSALLRQDITNVPDSRLDSIVPEFCAFAEQPDETGDIAALIRRGVHGLRPGLAPTPQLDARATTVIDAIRASDDLRISLDQAAAHAADFADAAHLTRTFYQMVGMAPSVLMRGDFIEIASPFNALPPNAGGRQPRPAE